MIYALSEQARLKKVRSDISYLFKFDVLRANQDLYFIINAPAITENITSVIIAKCNLVRSFIVLASPFLDL
jgi:hypothetical protein